MFLAKHSALVLKSHKLPCLRFYSSALSKVITSRPLEVATTAAGLTEGNEVGNDSEGTGVEEKVNGCRGVMAGVKATGHMKKGRGGAVEGDKWGGDGNKQSDKGLGEICSHFIMLTLHRAFCKGLND